MDQRISDIVQTAMQLFAHYGVGKTSMNEIAAAAGVARQTLYNTFDDKEELIFTALLHYAQKTQENVMQECASLTSPEDRIEILFDQLLMTPFEAMQAFPHLDEVLEIGNKLPDEKRHEITRAYVDAIGIVLIPYKIRLEERKIDFLKLCRFLKSTFSQLKREAVNKQHLRELFDPLKFTLLFCIRNF
ncbi:MAG: helix-turn-helix domain containing protein [Aestuariivita sp.]|nr:helix-turn-helix domain containing protein [Aestuariivita sp.]